MGCRAKGLGFRVPVPNSSKGVLRCFFKGVPQTLERDLGFRL